MESNLWQAPPVRIGPYRIERLLGRGGMGTVFLASREDDFERRVALKVVGQEKGGEDILSRFYNERQILANLEHPGIARLLDGGATEDGQPYFAMEYVEGERVDHYCERHQLSIVQRLRLFRKVCDAVQFAHQNLVVHRDIKAGNILVTETGAPRLLDFGIAKVLNSQKGFNSVATLPGQTPMTPAYASPEQVLNQPLTTACDVYALGVLLYRLLAGCAPYRLDGMTYSEMVEVICYREPTKPSHAVRHEQEMWEDARTTVVTGTVGTGTGQPTGESLPMTGGKASQHGRRRLSGDLDAIVLKAMRKDPRLRYGSAVEMAEDLRRYLKGLPVRARQGTWFYLARKFVWRYRVFLAAMLLVLGFSFTTTVLWHTAVEERTRAERVLEFLESLFKAANPDETGGEDLTVRDLLARGQARVAVQLSEEPEIAAEILGTLGNVYSNLGLFEAEAEVKKEALKVRRARDPRDRSALAKDLNNLASLLYQLGDYEGAEEKLRETIAMRRRLGESGDEIATNLMNLASTLSRSGRYDEAEEHYREVFAIYLDLHGPKSSEVATCLYGLGTLEFNRGDLEASEILLRQALGLRLEIWGSRHTLTAGVLNSLGRVLHARNDLDQALRFYREALNIRRRLLGEEHVRVAHTKKNLAALLLDRGELNEAGELIEQALATLRLRVPEGNLAIVDAERVLGAYLLAKGSFEEAEKYLLESYFELEKIRGASAPPTRHTLESLIALYDAWGRPAMAKKYRMIEQESKSRDSLKEEEVAEL